MTARRGVAVRRNATVKRPERHAAASAASSARLPMPNPAETGSAGFVQPVLPFPEPTTSTVPAPRRPALPPLPEHRPRTRTGRREFDALAALCRCPPCGVTFADEPALLAHRRNGVCLTPQAAGLRLLDRPYPCYGQEDR